MPALWQTGETTTSTKRSNLPGAASGTPFTMESATLIFPHQLFENHPAISSGRPIYLAEDPLIFGNDKIYPVSFHKQKLVLHRSSMQAYADELRELGHTIEIIPHTETFQTSLPPDITDIFLADPTDFILGKRLHSYVEKTGTTLHILPSPNFLSPSEFLDEHIGRKKKPFMASFYQAQRKRMNILIEENGEPTGGQWSFDEANRKKLPKNHIPPTPPSTAPDKYVASAISWVETHFPDNPGTTSSFRYPVTRTNAKLWLKSFLKERFQEFGPYEDAISTRHPFINHSLLTPILNIGLLTPEEIIHAALNTKAQIPINSLEGFIRQIIGWREFMHGIYLHRGVEIRTSNFFQHTRPIPQSFYDATTGIPPIDRIIKQLHTEAYAHHIERLMLLGNFMLLCRFDPSAVYKWFMELFIDSYDWVMVPNVYGMSQFADGGTFTTKPYISGSNYVRKMSDEKPGPWTEIWDALFWTFVADHQELFLKNPRSSMMARNWQKFSTEKKARLEQSAGNFLKDL
ncbi:cryptochrome/photolyase family protein [Luteolibacter sp. AS25]|uniref:cryptochrome/photolyase family protein n=1 Tax=Luteolibacter sp. AS25 TaxID=3135776 RepID=UPI00398B276E